MKRLYLCIGLVLAMVLGIMPLASAQGNQPIAVFIDGLPVQFDVQPLVHHGRTMVPFRAIAETLNLEVSWDEQNQTISATDGKTVVKLRTANSTVYLNQTPIFLDAVPIVDSGRVLIPLRFFSEVFNCKVEWDDTSGVVRITSPPKEMSVIGFYALGDSRTSSWTNLFMVPYPDTSTGNTDIVDEVALGWYSLDKNGNLLTKSRTGWQRPGGWENVLKAASMYQLTTEMVVHVTNGDGTLTSLLSSEAAMAEAVSGIVKEAALYQGINLDFEGLGYKEEGEQLLATQRAFNKFVQLLAEQTHEAGLKLTLTLHPPNSAYNGYDYKTLGQFADKIIIMAYDYGTKPEPNSLVIQAVEQSLSHVPKEKLILGISIPSENPESLLSKVGIAKQYRLEGIALWRLGLLTDDMWNTLRTTIEVKR